MPTPCTYKRFKIILVPEAPATGPDVVTEGREGSEGVKGHLILLTIHLVVLCLILCMTWTWRRCRVEYLMRRGTRPVPRDVDTHLVIVDTRTLRWVGGAGRGVRGGTWARHPGLVDEKRERWQLRSDVRREGHTLMKVFGAKLKCELVWVDRMWSIANIWRLRTVRKKDGERKAGWVLYRRTTSHTFDEWLEDEGTKKIRKDSVEIPLGAVNQMFEIHGNWFEATWDVKTR